MKWGSCHLTERRKKNVFNTQADRLAHYISRRVCLGLDVIPPTCGLSLPSPAMKSQWCQASDALHCSADLSGGIWEVQLANMGWPGKLYYMTGADEALSGRANQSRRYRNLGKTDPVKSATDWRHDHQECQNTQLYRQSPSIRHCGVQPTSSPVSCYLQPVLITIGWAGRSSQRASTCPF